MKQKFFLGALMAGMAFFTACSNDDEVAVSTPAPAEEEAQEIVLQVANDGDNMVGKRGGRPLYSSEAAQAVDKVVIYAIGVDGTSNNKVIKKFEVNNWDEVSMAYSDNTAGGEGEGRKYTLRLSAGNKLPEGKYRFVAYGYVAEAGTGYAANTYTYSDAGWTADGSAVYKDITATLAGNEQGEEVFAGENVNDVTGAAGASAAVEVKTFTFTEEDGRTQDTYTKGFSTTIRLARQVAGAFGYFEAIPADVNGKKPATLRLVAAQQNQTVTFNQFNTAYKVDADSLYQEDDVKYVVNGTNPATANATLADGTTEANVVYSINLNDWFADGDDNNDGLLGQGDTWAIPAAISASGAKFANGSVFGSSFIIPFEKVTGKVTFQLQLLSEAGDILKTWNVKLKNNDPQIAANGDSQDEYDIVRNHMYNLGYKADADNDEEIPGVEDPMDLSGDQDLYLDVHANWELLHQMELE